MGGEFLNRKFNGNQLRGRRQGGGVVLGCESNLCKGFEVGECGVFSEL